MLARDHNIGSYFNDYLYEWTGSEWVGRIGVRSFVNALYADNDGVWIVGGSSVIRRWNRVTQTAETLGRRANR